MRHFGIRLEEGADIQNLTVDSGTTFPTNPSVGELFFKTDTETLMVYDGVEWQPTAEGLGTVVGKTSNTGSAIMPTGTTAQRDGTPQTGYTRYNTTIKALEVYDSTTATWSPAGQGASGGVGNPFVYENDQVITQNYTLTAGKNGITAGPITINSGVTVTIPSGVTWTIVD